MAFFISTSLKIMNFSLLHPERLNDHRTLIDGVGLLIGDDSYFSALLRDCTQKHAFLFGSADAFCVVRLLPGMTLFVDIGCTYRAVYRDSYMADLIALAEDAGASAIEFLSARAGYHRVAPRHGFSCVDQNYNGKRISLWRKDL